MSKIITTVISIIYVTNVLIPRTSASTTEMPKWDDGTCQCNESVS